MAVVLADPSSGLEFGPHQDDPACHRTEVDEEQPPDADDLGIVWHRPSDAPSKSQADLPTDDDDLGIGWRSESEEEEEVAPVSQDVDNPDRIGATVSAASIIWVKSAEGTLRAAASHGFKRDTTVSTDTTAEVRALLSAVGKATRRTKPVWTKRTKCYGLAGLLGTIAGCAYSAVLIQLNERNFQELERRRALTIGNELMSSIRQQLETTTSSAKAIASLVQLDEGRSLLSPNVAEIDALRQAAYDVSALVDPTPENKTAAEGAKAAVKAQVMELSTRLNFNSVADSIINSFRGISNLQLAPGGVVGAIHPLPGNEGAIGLDLVFDPARKDGARSAIAAGKIMLSGPIRLVQNGKQALVARMPITVLRPSYVGHIPEFPNFWGFATMLCTLEDFFAATRLPTSEWANAFEHVLYAETPKGKQYLHSSFSAVVTDGVFVEVTAEPTWLSQMAGARNPVRAEYVIEELGVHWVIEFWPKEGWPAYSQTYIMMIVLCVLFAIASLSSLFSALVGMSVTREVFLLLKQVDEKDASRQSSSASI